MVKLEMMLGEAISNIREDRKTTKKLLQDLIKDMSTSPEDDVHKQVGIVAAKYVETLQRSKEGIFDLIKDVKDVA